MLSEFGLETNRANQLVVDSRLRTADPCIYAFGDCALARWAGQDTHLPARAHVPHQQASFFCTALGARICETAETNQDFEFRDYGSLVSIGHNRVKLH